MDMRKKIALGIPTVSNRSENMLLKSVTSLLEHLDDEDKELCTIVILDANVQAENSDHVMAVRQKYSAEIADSLLVILKTSEDDYPDLPIEAGDGYSRWMAKQTIDFSLMLEQCALFGDYVIQLDDDIQAAPNFLKRILNDISYFRYFDWITYRACSLGTIGVTFKSADVPQHVQYLRDNYLAEPVDWLQDKYVQQQCEQGRFHFITPRSLFLHIGLESTSDAATK